MNRFLSSHLTLDNNEIINQRLSYIKILYIHPIAISTENQNLYVEMCIIIKDSQTFRDDSN